MTAYEERAREPATRDEADELARVRQIATQLSAHLDAAVDLLAPLHVHGAPSKAIQDLVGTLLVERLDFVPELLLTGDEGLVSKPRPDFFLPLSGTSGVIAEVERGGTTANNHDLKDLWKAHISATANHLFLVVPRELHDARGRVRERPFPKVVARMGAFFTSPRTYVDVMSVHVFGY